MSNIFRKKGRSGAGSSDKRPPSRRDRDFLFGASPSSFFSAGGSPVGLLCF